MSSSVSFRDKAEVARVDQNLPKRSLKPNECHLINETTKPREVISGINRSKSVVLPMPE